MAGLALLAQLVEHLHGKEVGSGLARPESAFLAGSAAPRRAPKPG